MGCLLWNCNGPCVTNETAEWKSVDVERVVIGKILKSLGWCKPLLKQFYKGFG
jgi:hypothetical protein